MGAPPRLYHEAKRTASLLKTSLIFEVFGVISLTVLLAIQGANLVSVWRLVAAIVGTTMTAVVGRRWQRRAAWYAETELWWERLDEMPPVVPFPRLADWLDGSIPLPQFDWLVRRLRRRTP